VGHTSRRWSVVAVIDRINPSHWSLASLFFDNVRHEPRRAGDHENAIERCGVHSQIGKDGADSAVHIGGSPFSENASPARTDANRRKAQAKVFRIGLRRS